jgi:hypothetical protein
MTYPAAAALPISSFAVRAFVKAIAAAKKKLLTSMTKIRVAMVYPGLIDWWEFAEHYALFIFVLFARPFVCFEIEMHLLLFFGEVTDC